MEHSDTASIVSLGASLKGKQKKLWKKVEDDVLGDDPNYVITITPKHKKNGERDLFMLYCDGQAVGRAAIVVDARWVREKNENTGFIDDFVIHPNHVDLSDMLIEHCLYILKQKGVDSVIVRHGGFPALAAQEFHDLAPASLPCNPPWYIELFERNGFVKHKEWGNFRLSIPTQCSAADIAKWESILACHHSNAQPLDVKNWNQVKQYSNLTYEVLVDHYGYIPTRFMDSHSIIHFVGFGILCKITRLKVYVIQDSSGKIVGFLSYHPDYNVIKKSLRKYSKMKWYNPQTFLAISSFISSIRTNKRAAIGSIGFAKESRKKGFIKAIDYGVQFLIKEGYEQLDSGPVLIENAVVVKMIERFSKRYDVDMKRTCYYTLMHTF